MAELTFFPVIRAEELPNGERIFFEINALPIVLFNIAGAFFAIGDVCTHDDGPLGEGDLDGFQVICPRHGARFDVRTGEAVQLPAVRPTPGYAVRIVDGVVEIGLEL